VRAAPAAFFLPPAPPAPTDPSDRAAAARVAGLFRRVKLFDDGRQQVTPSVLLEPSGGHLCISDGTSRVFIHLALLPALHIALTDFVRAQAHQPPSRADIEQEKIMLSAVLGGASEYLNKTIPGRRDAAVTVQRPPTAKPGAPGGPAPWAAAGAAAAAAAAAAPAAGNK